MSPDERGRRATYHQDQGCDNTPEESDQGLDEALLVTHNGEEALLEEERGTESCGKWPAKDTSNCKPEHALGGLQAAAPVHERRSTQHSHVHCEARGQIRGARMEVAGAGDEGHDEEDANPGIQGTADDPPHPGLAEGTGEGQCVAHKVELGDLCRPRQQSTQIAHDGMEADVEPASDGIVGRVFPGLQAVAMAEVMSRFPVVEGLVAVLYRGKSRCDQVRDEEAVEG